MNEEERKTRREIANSLRKPGDRPDPSVSFTRRIFLHRSLLAGAAVGAASYGWLPLINTIDMAVAATDKGGQGETIRFAWLSDTHLYPKDVNTRFVAKAKRAVREIKAMDPPADFLIFGGDMAQLGDPLELVLGAEILKELDIEKHFIPGEHDWYLDLGVLWEKKFGESPWTFDLKGVRFIGLNTVGQVQDYWTATKMTPKERMGHMATLDGSVAGAWAGLGDEQLKWLQDTLADWPMDQSVVIFSHNPLYEYYPPWNFWVRDWRQVHEIVAPYSKVTNLHGHTHQVLYNEIGKMRSIGMLATSWPWPYAPEGVPRFTKPMIRVDIGDHFDGLGWGKETVIAGAPLENEYILWNEREGHDFAKHVYDSGTGDNSTQVTHSRIADRMWPY